MSSLNAKTANGIRQAPEVWWDPERAKAVFLLVQENDLGMIDRDRMAEMIADIWRGDIADDVWTTLLIMTPHLPHPVPCTVERNRWQDATAVFRGADGAVLYSMKI